MTTEPAMMKIYDLPRGPYSARVRVARAEKGLRSQVRFELIDLYKGEHKKALFIATKNFSGTVPVLELDDGTLIAECTAISEYLDALDGEPEFTGRNPRDRRLGHILNKIAEIEMLDVISVYFHHSAPGLGPEVNTFQNPEWGDRQREKAIR